PDHEHKSEYAGYIYLTSEGIYVADAPEKFKGEQFEITKNPALGTAVAVYHSHPHDSFIKNAVFSQEDGDIFNSKQLISYLMNSYDEKLRYNGTQGKSGEPIPCH